MIERENGVTKLERHTIESGGKVTDEWYVITSSDGDTYLMKTLFIDDRGMLWHFVGWEERQPDVLFCEGGDLLIPPMARFESEDKVEILVSPFSPLLKT